MDVSVKINRMSDGRVVADVIETDTALPYCFYLSTYLRDRFDGYNSMATAANQTLFSIKYFNKKGVDVVERIKTGHLFTSEEYDDFKYVCKFKAKKASQLSASNVLSFEQMSSKKLDNLLHATQQTNDRVASDTFKSRLYYFKYYIEYYFKALHAVGSTPLEVKERYDDFIATIESDLRQARPSNSVVRDPFEQAIPTDVYLNILDVIQPFNEKNPFHKAARLRNQLIIQIFNETAIRIGALCKLKVSDLRIDDKAPRFHVTRTPNDHEDTRNRPATQKTKAHIGTLSQKTMDRLLLYIETQRAQYPAANEHEFIFVSTQKTPGQPIAKSSVQDVIERLSKEVGFHLYPHLFRHKWQEVFEDRAEEMGYTHDQINDMRKAACGWTESSQMILIYNEFKNAVNVQKMSAIRQSEFVPKINKNKEDCDA
ncbi:site-specific integrase [Pseudoalteromonas marina]|uniref:site-specific integrase n=1 Tax=Pseudoalteromonas marina TaxID=267375 RepID=UPI0035C82BE9